MLYHLLYPLHEQFAVFNVFRYITFRTAGAIVTAILLALVLGPRFIATLRRLSVGQNIREVGPQSHQVKAGTPTMGGLLILFTLVVPTLLWANLGNLYVWIAIGVTIGFGSEMEKWSNVGFKRIITPAPFSWIITPTPFSWPPFSSPLFLVSG